MIGGAMSKFNNELMLRLLKVEVMVFDCWFGGMFFVNMLVVVDGVMFLLRLIKNFDASSVGMSSVAYYGAMSVLND